MAAYRPTGFLSSSRPPSGPLPTTSPPASVSPRDITDYGHTHHIQQPCLFAYSLPLLAVVPLKDQSDGGLVITELIIATPTQKRIRTQSARGCYTHTSAGC